MQAAHQNSVLPTPLHVSLPLVAADVHQRLNKTIIPSAAERKGTDMQQDGQWAHLIFALVLVQLTGLLQSLQCLQSLLWLSAVPYHWLLIYNKLNHLRVYDCI